MAVRPLIFLLFSTLILVVCSQPTQFTIAGLFPITTFNFDTLVTEPSSPETLSQITAFELAISDINNDPTILGGTTLDYYVFDTQATTTGALAALVEAVSKNVTLIIGPSTSDQSTISAVAGGVYDVFLLSPTASSTSLSDKTLYPYFARSVPPDTEQAEAMIEFILYYHNITGIAQWLNVSVICTADDYGVDGSKQFIALGEASEPKITTKSFQQFLIGATDVTIEVRELKDSGARVFIAYMAGEGYRTVLKEAKKKEIIGDYYVWICSDGCASDVIFEVPDGDQLTSKTVKQLSRGLVGTSFSGGRGIRYDEYLDRWYNLDPAEYPGAGQTPEVASLLAYDSVYAAAFALQTLFDSLIYQPTGLDLFEAITFIEFIGVTGDYNIDEVGDRDGDYTIENVWPDYTFYPVFYWNQSTGLVPIAETHWHDGTTEIPDLSVKEEFDYWSCHKKEQGTDPTGKTIHLEKPDGDDVNYIDADYECDQFIDCQNMSDESFQCGPSFVIAFIVLGIITGVLIGVLLCIIIFIIIFGWVVPRARIWLSGKTFLLFLTIAALVCCGATYAWYGKAHTVACNFQLWLFGLSASAIASAFFAKQIRFWREMEFPIQKVRKSKVFTVLKKWKEVEFIAWFCLAMIFPLFILILWTAMSTPIADIEDIDGDDHYICTSGGVGKPAGVVLFFILFGYLEFLLFVCLGFSFLLRHVPQPFMDKRLVSIAVFNLIFVSAVVVGIFFVLRWISPFAAWLIRTIAMLYCPLSSVLLMMVPKMVGIVIVDRFQQNLGRGRGPGPTKNSDQSVPLDPSMSSSNTQSMGL